MSFDYESIKAGALTTPIICGIIALVIVVNTLFLAKKSKRALVSFGSVLSALIVVGCLLFWICPIFFGGYNLLSENGGDAVTVNGVISEMEELNMLQYSNIYAPEGMGRGPSAGAKITIGDTVVKAPGFVFHDYTVGDDVTVKYMPKSGYALEINHTDGVGSLKSITFDYGSDIFRNSLVFPMIFGIITLVISIFCAIGTLLLIAQNDRFKQVCTCIFGTCVVVFFFVWNALILYNGGFALLTERHADAVTVTGEITEIEGVSTFVFSKTSTDYGSGARSGARLMVNGIELTGPGVIDSRFDVGDKVTVTYMPKSGYVIAVSQIQ